jgi:hypothetical protein
LSLALIESTLSDLDELDDFRLDRKKTTTRSKPGIGDRALPPFGRLPHFSRAARHVLGMTR